MRWSLFQQIGGLCWTRRLVSSSVSKSLLVFFGNVLVCKFKKVSNITAEHKLTDALTTSSWDACRAYRFFQQVFILEKNSSAQNWSKLFSVIFFDHLVKKSVVFFNHGANRNKDKAANFLMAMFCNPNYRTTSLKAER